MCRPSPWGLEPEPRDEASEHEMSPAGRTDQAQQSPELQKREKRIAHGPEGPGGIDLGSMPPVPKDPDIRSP
jgi:hypothetical protein